VEVKRAAVAAAAVEKARGITLAEPGAAPVDVEIEGSLRTNHCHGEVPAGKVSRRLDARELASFTREDVRRKHAALTAEIAARHKTDEWRRRKAGDGRATANN